MVFIDWFIYIIVNSNRQSPPPPPPPHSIPQNRFMVNHNVLIILNEFPMKYNKHMYVKAEVLLEFHLRLGRGLNSHTDMQNLLS